MESNLVRLDTGEIITVDEMNCLVELWVLGLIDYPIATDIYHVTYNI